jgi:hypothetical protein
MADILDLHPEIVQLALRRQPWNRTEIDAGGVVEVNPEAYVDAAGRVDGRMQQWLEHRLFWTTNPSLFQRDLLNQFEWPMVEHSEGIFTRQVLADSPINRFGYWGDRDSGEWVRHIGEHRVGTGY